MKDNIININLETSTAPTVQEVRGSDWIEYGGTDRLAKFISSVPY